MLGKIRQGSGPGLSPSLEPGEPQGADFPWKVDQSLGDPGRRTCKWEDLGDLRKIVAIPDEKIIQGVRKAAGEQKYIRDDLSSAPIVCSLSELPQFLAQVTDELADGWERIQTP
ncbi:MAG: hypothetical protein WCD43_06275 [Candidatus Acidiferrales bacterium]